MSMTSNGVPDPDDALRMLDLALGAASGCDLVMMIEHSGTPIEGELDRRFEDGKPRMEIAGYFWGAHQHSQSGRAAAARALSNFIVVRRTDAATASIASLLRVNAEAGKVVVSVYKSGGDVKSAEAQAMLEFTMEKVRVTSHMLLTNSVLGVPTEIISFAFRRFSIRSAPQKEAGARGAVRECVFESAE